MFFFCPFLLCDITRNLIMPLREAEFRINIYDVILASVSLRLAKRNVGYSNDFYDRSKLNLVGPVVVPQRQLDQTSMQVDMVKVEEVELDEMWSFVGKKSNQRWLWHGIDHNTHEVLASHLGQRKDKAFKAL